MYHVMIDGESLGLAAGSVVADLAMVVFTADGQIVNKHDWFIDIQSSLNAGLTISGDTLVWWMGQPDDARKHVFRLGGGMVPQILPMVMTEVSMALQALGDFCIWSNGAGFDLPMVRAMYYAVKMPVPWYHRNEMCYRTVLNMYGDPGLLRSGIKHTGIADAMFQTRSLIAMAKSFPEILKCRVHSGGSGRG